MGGREVAFSVFSDTKCCLAMKAPISKLSYVWGFHGKNTLKAVSALSCSDVVSYLESKGNHTALLDMYST